MASVALTDRGLAYGDGLFETLRVSASGQAPLWPLHCQRLTLGAKALGLPEPAAGELAQALASAVSALHGQQGVVKLIYTRGEGGRGYAAPQTVRPTLRWLTAPLPQWQPADYESGIEVGLCSAPLYPDMFGGLKHLNRLPQVAARAEVSRQGWAEGLMLSSRKQPLEATAMNLFARFDDHWWTPDLDSANAGVKGVMRQWLLAHWQKQSEAVRVDLRPLSQLRHANSVFLANSVAGVLPVRKLAQWQWPVCADIRQLQREISALFV